MSDLVHHPLDLAYTAGIIDGEGCIGITELKADGKRRKSPQIKGYVSIAMSDPRVLYWMVERYGGTVHGYPARKTGQKGSFHWRLQSKKAAEFCAVVRDHLLLKREQADLLIAFYNDPRFTFKQRQGIPIEEINQRREYVSAIQSLNRRGE